MEKPDIKLELLSRAIARYFSRPGNPIACACVGLSCCDIECAIWWEFFLRDRNKLEKMVRTLEQIHEIWNKGN